MPDEQLDVFQDKSFRSLRGQDSCDIEKERSASILETAHMPYDTKRLAGKAREKQIVIGNAVFIHPLYVSHRPLPKVGFVGSLAVLVNV